MPWLLVSWFLSFGYVPSQTDTIGIAVSKLDTSRIATVAEIGLSFNAFDRLSVYGSIENFQYIAPSGMFYPFRADYKAGIELEVTKNFSILAEHTCDHPVSFTNEPYSKARYLSSETKITVRISVGNVK